MSENIMNKASYKLRSIYSNTLFGEDYNKLFAALKVERDENNELNAEQLAIARNAFNALVLRVNLDAAKPFEVNIKDCFVNNGKQSIASDVMMVEYGRMAPTTRMISVHHALFNTMLAKACWQVAGNDQRQAVARIEAVEKAILDRLVSSGVLLKTATGEIRYGFLGATPSQKKTGSCYMGEAGIMALEPVQKALNAGRLFKEFNETMKTDAVELTTMNSYMFTPSAPTSYRMHDIIVMDSIAIKQTFKKICRIGDDGKLHRLTDAELEVTKFDGMVLFVLNGQLRGWMFKGYGCDKDAVIKYCIEIEGHDPDEIIIDKYGVEHRFSDVVGITTTDAWKGSKYFGTYQEYLNVLDELVNYFPNIDKVWVVREAGVNEEGEDIADFGRTLSRQTTQQFMNASLAELAALTKYSRNHLKRLKTFDGLKKSLGEEAKPLQERSDFAALIDYCPELELADTVQTYSKTVWTNEKTKACSNKIRIGGNYPYIIMDPVAMAQILIFHHDPNEQGLGLLKGNEVNNTKYRDNVKLFSIRYPSNYMTATVVINRRFQVFDSLGEVAVISYYGDWIIRQDGDFDGDEAMFSPNKLLIKLTEQMIARYQPELIDFPHGRKSEKAVFGTRANRNKQIAECLWRAMKFNTVGIYSNLAVACFYLKDMDSAIMAHVMAILSIDMVKGVQVPQGIINKAEAIQKRIRKEMQYCMPWNQQFRDALKHITGRAYLACDKSSTPDMIASLICSDVGEYAFDGQGHVLTGDTMLAIMNGSNMSTRQGVVPAEFAAAMRDAFSRTDKNAEDLEFYRKLANGQKVGIKDILEAAAINESAMVYSCPGETVNDKRIEYRKMIRHICLNLGSNEDWTTKDGVLIPIDERHARVVNYAAKLFINGIGDTEEDRSRIGMFVGRTFAIDFINNYEANNSITGDDTLEARRQIAMLAETIDMDNVPSIDDEDIDE